MAKETKILVDGKFVVNKGTSEESANVTVTNNAEKIYCVKISNSNTGFYVGFSIATVILIALILLITSHLFYLFKSNKIIEYVYEGEKLIEQTEFSHLCPCIVIFTILIILFIIGIYIFFSILLFKKIKSPFIPKDSLDLECINEHFRQN